MSDSKNQSLLPYEKDLVEGFETAERFITSKVMSQSMRSMYETERTLNECQSYLMQLRIDQKSMPPSNKKKDLKTRIQDYYARYDLIDSKFKKIKLGFGEGDTADGGKKKKKGSSELPGFGSSSSDDDDDLLTKKRLLNDSCDMEFESESQKSSNALFKPGDKEMQVEGRSSSGSTGANKALSKTEKEIQKQNAMIQDALKMGLNTH